ncbi:MAG: HAMP domain-containing histidine kinase [Planctomycetaceae bacterium]|nr:HAMP domain-containing histidine kinase [Planctomycetaceae bacterium]
MATPWQRSRFRWPITLSASLMALNVTLMVCWIVLFVGRDAPGALTIGVIAFALILIGLSFWLVLTIKEIRLNHRQANFVDSVTHELKSPIAALQLYLETLQMRSLDDAKRAEFHAVMEQELHRLDRLINQLLEVGRLDAVGHHEEANDVQLQPLIEQAVNTACAHHKCEPETAVTLDVPAAVINARRMMLEMIFTNLIDNAVKYAGDPPEISIRVRPSSVGWLKILIGNNGPGIPHADRKKVFKIFYRGGNELHRRRKGTGLGLYIVHTLVKKLKGRVSVRDHHDGSPGCVFVLELPGELVETLETLRSNQPPRTKSSEMSTSASASG